MSILDNVKGDGKLQREEELAVKEECLDRKVDAVMQTYTSWIKGESWSPWWEYDYNTALERLQDHVVDQGVIDGFCLRLGPCPGRYAFKEHGPFISALIQNAYNNGCNDLVIKTAWLEREASLIGAFVSGTKEDPLRLTISGDAGRWCGEKAEHSEFTFTGDAGGFCGAWAKNSSFLFKGYVDNGCGYEAEHSEFAIEGDAGLNCGHGAVHCDFTVKGNVDLWLGQAATHGRFVVDGDVNHGCGKRAVGSDFTLYGNVGAKTGFEANDCIFRSPKVEILKEIMEWTDSGCIYYLIGEGVSR